jgi:hypothetical protein
MSNKWFCSSHHRPCDIQRLVPVANCSRLQRGLFEANYKWLLGLIFGCCMVCGAEGQNHLFDSQWGACPGESTEQPNIHKTMSYEISRMTPTPLETLDNCAKASYDCIVMVLALMSDQKHGVPQSARMMVAIALLAANHSIKTGFGVSKGT